MKKLTLLLILFSFAILPLFSQEKNIEKALNLDNPPLKGFSLRTNVIPWLVLFPSAGFEYRTSDDFGLLLNGVYGRWTWGDHLYHRLLQISPQARFYLGMEKKFYLGIEGQLGQYNFKYTDEGVQGDFIGGGVSFGHQFYVSENLKVDLGLSLGYLYLHKVEDHTRADNRNVLLKRYNSAYWGPTALSMTFVWKIK